jgi:hypothetical protein
MARKTTWPPQLENRNGRASLRWTHQGVRYCFACGPWDTERNCPSMEAERERVRVLREVEAGRDPRATRRTPELRRLRLLIQSLDTSELSQALELILDELKGRSPHGCSRHCGPN